MVSLDRPDFCQLEVDDMMLDKQSHFFAGAAIAASVALYLDPMAGLAAGILAPAEQREGAGVYVLSAGTAVDREHNFPRSAAVAVNSRNSVDTVARQNNGVHPADSGYQQIADSWWGWIKYLATL